MKCIILLAALAAICQAVPYYGNYQYYPEGQYYGKYYPFYNRVGSYYGRDVVGQGYGYGHEYGYPQQYSYPYEYGQGRGYGYVPFWRQYQQYPYQYQYGQGQGYGYNYTPYQRAFGQYYPYGQYQNTALVH